MPETESFEFPRNVCSESKFLIPDKEEDDVNLALIDEFSLLKVFINHIDTYHGRHISKFLATQPVGILTTKQAENENEVEPILLEDTVADLTPKTSIHSKVIDEVSKYIVIGTSKTENYEKSEEIAELVNDTDPSILLTKLLGCKYIIYDVSEDASQVKEAEWAIRALDEEITRRKETGERNEYRTFILISTALTWALTKPLDPEEPDEAFTEDDYRLRRAHLNYKDHLALEKEVIKIGKKHKKEFKTIVVACGLVYGLEENLMGILFKLAWLHEPLLHLSPGNNYVPLLHINDLANIIYHLLESMPKKRWYILAVEETVSTLKEIVKAISRELGSGKMAKLTKEEAFALKDMNENVYDHMTMNLNMQPEYIMENMTLEYAPDDNEMSFLENIENTVSEFVQLHGLKPIKIFIHGPPMSGKTFIANKVCRHYQLHYLCFNNVLQDFSSRMEEKLKLLEAKEYESQKSQESENNDKEEDDDENEEGESEEEDEDDLLELFQSVKEAKANDLPPEEDIVIKIFKEKLRSKPCQKQGFVLDGFPETYEQAKKLFSLSEDDEDEDDDDDEEEEDEEEEDEVPIPVEVNKKLMPVHIFNLEAENQLLFKRAAKVSPERNINGHYDEENMKQILREFRLLNTDANTVMNFFDEVEYYPQNISVMDDERPLLEKAFQKMLTVIGNPSNLGPVEDEEEKISEEEKALIQLQKEEELKNRLEQERLEKVQRRNKMEEWAKLMSSKKQEEERLLEAKTIPIREYLTKEIFPYLKAGLLEIYKIKPTDPVDYLAEYLFTHYIDGKVFPPEANEINDDLLSSVLHMFKCLDKT